MSTWPEIIGGLAGAGWIGSLLGSYSERRKGRREEEAELAASRSAVLALLREELARLNGRVGALEAKVKAQGDEIGGLSRELHNTTLDRDRLREEVVELQAELADLEQRLQAERGEKTALSVQLEATKLRLAELQELYEQATQMIPEEDPCPKHST